MENTSRKKLFDEDRDYVNEDHISSFAKALAWEEQYEILENEKSGASSDKEFQDTATIRKEAEEIDDLGAEELSTALNGMHKPDLISSKSDWWPINTSKSIPKTKIRKKSKKSSVNEGQSKITNEFRSSASYTMLRWPILIFILCWISLLCFMYIIVRAYVALLEYFLTWVGKRKELRNKLRASRNYREWVQNALELDRFLNLDKWSENPKFSYYDYKTVELTISKLASLREEGRDNDLMVILQGCIKKNFAGIENRQLYSHRYYGTKYLVEKYIDEVIVCIDKVIESQQISFNDKRRFFRTVLKNYGKTALCLSGGACFTYTHFGIVKALLDNDLLPSIISGTSGGGLIAALSCTRTDDELKKLLVPELARKITACEDPWYVWVPRWWKTGARFDSLEWARKANFFTRGSTTFYESFKRTGRRLNISTVPSNPHSPVILCNNITSPNCIIWSSLLASSAVPGILNPVVLLMKDLKTDRVVPFSLGSKWRDGSLRTDIPIDALNTYYNVNFSIVSQVNPHILLFFFAPKGTVGRPVAIPRRKTHKEKYASLRGGFIATALEQLFKLEITKWLQMVKSLDLLPHLLEQDWLNIWLQRFSGSITIWPRNRLKDFWYILSDPTEERLAEMLSKGERAMFPRILFVKHRLSIEKAIEKGRKLTKLSANFNTMTSSDSARTELSPEAAEVQVEQAMFDDDYDSDSSDEEVLSFNNRKHIDSFGTPNSEDGDDDEGVYEYYDDDDYGLSTGDEANEENTGNSQREENGTGSRFIKSLFRAGSRDSKLHRRNTVF